MTQVERVFTTSIGGEFSAVWYTSLFRTGWFGTKISFLNLFVIFHQELAILGRIRLPHAGFLFYWFQCESLLSVKFLADFWTAHPAVSILCSPRILRWNPLRRDSQCHQEWFLSVLGDIFRSDPCCCSRL